MVVTLMTVNAQTALKKVYDESIDPMEQIDKALAVAKTDGKFVVCQVGGNWCPWCLRFADFAETNEAVSKMIGENFVLIHVNYNPRKAGGEEAAQKAAKLMERLDNPARFGFPVFVVLAPTVRYCTRRTQVSSKRTRATARRRCYDSSRIGPRRL